MAKILETDGSCPHCKKRFSSYNASSSDFGSPIRKCRYCQKEYLDRRYHEIAVEGWNESSLNPMNSLKVAGIGLAGVLIAGGLTAYTIYTKGYYMMKGALAGILAFVIMIVGIVDFIRVKTGAKQRSIDKKKVESEERLKNREYAMLLAENGYNVPEKYL